MKKVGGNKADSSEGQKESESDFMVDLKLPHFPRRGIVPASGMRVKPV